MPSGMNRGDILLFNIKTIHAATVQTNHSTRFSLDTRITTCCPKGRDEAQ